MVMERNAQGLDPSIIKILYDKEVARLHAHLLSGASWEETAEQRRLVTELSIALGRSASSPSTEGNPAERQGRDDNKRGNNSPA
jgi:hypothetical protein